MKDICIEVVGKNNIIRVLRDLRSKSATDGTPSSKRGRDSSRERRMPSVAVSKETRRRAAEGF